MRSRLDRVRDDIVEKRTTLLPLVDLAKSLHEAITEGEETDAYLIYKKIMKSPFLRKYPYYFEIETKIVDTLNTVVKQYYVSSVKQVALTLLERCREEVAEFIEAVKQKVDYDQEVIIAIRDCLSATENQLHSGIGQIVETDASMLDGLLVYRKQKGGVLSYFFPKQNEIFVGLQAAAELGYDKISNPTMKVSPEDFQEKTNIIRDTLKKHYIDSEGRVYEDDVRRVYLEYYAPYRIIPASVEK